MKYLLMAIILIHGLIHLMGFVKEYNLAPASELTIHPAVRLSHKLEHTIGLFWLIVTLAFIIAALVMLLQRPIWWLPAIIAVVFSQSLIILYWQDAKWGTIANAIVLVAALLSFSEWNLNRGVKKEVTAMLSQPIPATKTIITEPMLAGLPSPVQNWLRHSGIIGKEQIYAVRLKQKGLMRLKPGSDKWIETTAVQYFRIDDPAFIWKVKMMYLPMVPVSGRDKFVDGHGQMQIKAFSLFNIVNQSNEKISQGALQRFLSEIIWFPSAALNPYIKWEAIDTLSAKATITAHGVRGSLVFYFNEKGEPVRSLADRYMGGGKEATLEKWQTTTLSYGELNGVRMPVTSEATWKLKEGDFTWYKLQVTEVEYNGEW